jgi:predicted DNA-binding protein YlxM (UPF0122 family)
LPHAPLGDIGAGPEVRSSPTTLYRVKGMALTADLARSRSHRLQLLDAYGPVLTERQREALRLHLEEDWSVTELADSLGVSRAAAHDLIRRGLRRVEELESSLGLCGQLAAAEARVADLERRLSRLPAEQENHV